MFRERWSNIIMRRLFFNASNKFEYLVDQLTIDILGTDKCTHKFNNVTEIFTFIYRRTVMGITTSRITSSQIKSRSLFGGIGKYNE